MKNRKIWRILLLAAALLLAPAIVIRLYFPETAISLLTQIKKASGQAVDLQALYANNSRPPDHAPWDSLLQRHVDAEGGVNYRGFREERAALQAYLDTLAVRLPNTGFWTEDERLAYWINAYNAFTVELILRHYPLQSIKEIAGSVPMINSPWDLKFFRIGGILFDLNTIEHEILRREFAEPRIHFAVNCASISCPKLRNEAYTAERLEAQLQDQAHFFLNRSGKNRISREKVSLSPIFQWFRSDFTRNGSLIDFLNRYSAIAIDPDARVTYLDYDWGLNGR